MAAAHSILWRCTTPPGHEAVRLHFDGTFWKLEGTAVFAYDGHACRLSYAVTCNEAWETVSGSVLGSIGVRAIEHRIEASADRTWRLDGVHVPAVDGCIDIDLNFSPSTNLLPIRRLGLDVGQEAELVAAWLRFPSLTLEPLQQTYRRLSATTYRYTSNHGKFVAELETNEAGFVLVYPGFCETLLS